MKRGQDRTAIDREHSYWKLAMGIHDEDPQREGRNTRKALKGSHSFYP